jgi:hypothetical protein
MKLINKILKLTFFTTLLFFTISCEKDSLENYTNGNEITNSNKALKLKPISYSTFKKNSKAFNQFKEVAFKRKPSLANARTAYNEEYGLFVDTLSIKMIETDNSQSITLRIINDNDSKVENLVLQQNTNLII